MKVAKARFRLINHLLTLPEYRGSSVQWPQLTQTLAVEFADLRAAAIILHAEGALELFRYSPSSNPFWVPYKKGEEDHYFAQGPQIEMKPTATTRTLLSAARSAYLAQARAAVGAARQHLELADSRNDQEGSANRRKALEQAWQEYLAICEEVGGDPEPLAQPRQTRNGAVGPQVPDFDLVEEVGSGGFGQVFRARPSGNTSAPEVAVKLINPSVFAEDADQDRFLREAEALSRIKHRAIVSYLGCGFTKDDSKRPYITMDLIDGAKLATAAVEWTVQKKVEAVIQVLDALEFSHKTGILHRDVRPGNIMVRKSDQQVILIDFGQAYLFESLNKRSLTERMVGSIGYIPPEVQANPALRTYQHDVFSCGVSLYELLAGRRPVPPNPTPLSEYSPELAGLDPILAKALAASEIRFKTAGEFAESLRLWLRRKEASSNFEPSSRLVSFRAKLLQSKTSAEAKKRAEEQRTAAIRAQMEAHHQLILDVANRAADHVFATLDEISTGHTLHRRPDTQFREGPTGSNGALPYIWFKYPKVNRQLAVGLSKPEVVKKIRGKLFGAQTPGAIAKVSGFHWLETCWVVATEGAQSPQLLIQGFVLAGIRTSDMNSADPKVILFRDRMVSETGARIPPAEVTNPQELYDYFIYILTAVLG